MNTYPPPQQSGYPPQQPSYPPQQPGYPPGNGRPAWAPSPAPSKMSSGRIVALFVGVLLALALIAGVLIFLGRPAPPVAPCAPAQPCAPGPSLPPVGSSPLPISTPRPGSTPRPVATPGAPGASLPIATPDSGSPPYVSGTVYTDPTLGYSFEYDPDAWTLANNVPGSAVLNSQVFDAQVWVDAKAADTSTQQMIQTELGDVDRFLTARTADTDTYDALLGPEIGYVSGAGGVWSGTLIGQDGSPLAPGGVTIVAATDGRITVAVVIVVGTPDAQQQGNTQQHFVRTAADDILKTFQWPAQ